MSQTKSPSQPPPPPRFTDADSSLARVSINILGEIDNRPAVIAIIAGQNEDGGFSEHPGDMFKADAVRFQGQLYFPAVRTSLGVPV